MLIKMLLTIAYFAALSTQALLMARFGLQVVAVEMALVVGGTLFIGMPMYLIWGGER